MHQLHREIREEKEMAFVSFNKTVLRNLFSRPKTRLTEKTYPEGTRGHVENDMDLCILCGLCSIKCPTHAITVDKAEKTWSIRPMSCIQCRCCVDNCPKKSLSMGLRFQEPGSEKVTKTFKQSEKAIAAQEALMKAARERAQAAAAAKAAQAKAAQNAPVNNAEKSGTVPAGNVQDQAAPKENK